MLLHLILLTFITVFAWHNDFVSAVTRALTSRFRGLADMPPYELVVSLERIGTAIYLILIFRDIIFVVYHKIWRATLSRMRRTAGELLAVVEQPPILFLRSFKDDERHIPAQGSLLRLLTGAGSGRVRVEEAIAELLFFRGPFVALANPGRPHDDLGAARDRVENDQWQDRIRELAGKASTIVLFLGRTEGLRWEIELIVEANALHKLLLILPPSYPDRMTISEIDGDLARLLGIGSAGDERSAFDGAKAMLIRPSTGRLVCLVDRGSGQPAYREAVRFATRILDSASQPAGARDRGLGTGSPLTTPR